MNKKLRHQLNPSLSADCVIFGFDGNDLKVLLIERSLEFQEKMLSTLPGDIIYEHEDL
jgi:8-oxo-dGTP diphosphatase